MDYLTPAQVRGARGMLDWSMLDLAKAAKVSVSTIKHVSDGGQGVAPEAVSAIRNALEIAGVEFLTDEGEGPAIRLRPRQTSPFPRFL